MGDYGAHLLASDGYAEIGGLVVSTECRRQGVGRALMTASEQWAQDNAHLFYEKIGRIASKQSMIFKKDISILLEK